VRRTPGSFLADIAAFRLAELKLNVFGHHNVSHHHETVPLPYPLHDFQKQVVILRGAQQRPSLITTGGDEVWW